MGRGHFFISLEPFFPLPPHPEPRTPSDKYNRYVDIKILYYIYELLTYLSVPPASLYRSLPIVQHYTLYTFTHDPSRHDFLLTFSDRFLTLFVTCFAAPSHRHAHDHRPERSTFI